MERNGVLSYMKKFTKNLQRSTVKNFSMAPGSTILNFVEDENGKSFSECIDDLLNTTSITGIQEKNDVLALRYFLSVSLESAPDKEDLQDVQVGLENLDKASAEYRESIAINDMERARIRTQRVQCNLHVHGTFDAIDYSQNFNYCTVDLSDLSLEEIEKGALLVVGYAQRQNPTTFVIPTRLANKLTDDEYKKSYVGKIFTPRIHSKAVFAPYETGDVKLENNFVRGF